VKNGTNCTTTTINSPTDLTLPGGGQAVETLLSFSPNSTQTYLGVSTARGVPVDCWQSINTYTENRTSTNTVHHINLTYCFTQASWGFRGDGNTTVKPMRAIMEGNRTYANGTVYTITHYYEFVNFVGRKPLDMWFAVPNACGNFSALFKL